MRPRRSTVDWILEAAALAALVAMFAIVAAHWGEIPRPRLRFLPPRAVHPWDPRIVLAIMMALGSATYVLLSLSGRFQKLMNIEVPYARQQLLSMTIVLKAVVMLLLAYLSWTLVAVVTGHGRGLRPGYLALFVAAVPVPLILYTVKLRRYRR